MYREWAPGAAEAQLIGDFNGWEGQPMERDDFGTWSIRCAVLLLLLLLLGLLLLPTRVLLLACTNSRACC